MVVVLARQFIDEGAFTSEVATVSGAMQIIASLDATGYVDGNALGLSLQTHNDDGWGELCSATINERGLNMDGSPGSVWEVGYNFDAPFSGDARAVITLTGPGLTTECSIRSS